MSEMEKHIPSSREIQESDEGSEIKVNDRRRFDPEGNPRDAGPTTDPPTPRPVAPDNGAAALRAQVEADNEALRQELEAARKRVDELARAFQALSTDREDFKQRLARERERMLDIEKGNIALVLLEVLDELDLSLQAAANDESPLATGVRLIRDGILTKLQTLGIERFDPLGQRFDPNLAEATDVEMTTDPADDQKIVAVTRAGYRLKDRIIRPARVKVARYVRPVDA